MFHHHDTTKRGEVPAGTSAEVDAACKKWNLCDHFCVMLYAVLKQHLQGYGAEVSWAVLEVVPRIYLAFHGELPEGFRHSVLYVRTAAGESFVFDCTGEQFGWPTSDWLTADITKNMKDARASWDDGAILLKVTRSNIFLTDGGYWKGLIKSLNVMFDKFNWDSMAEMDRVNMENQVQEEAERRAQAAAVETWG